MTEIDVQNKFGVGLTTLHHDQSTEIGDGEIANIDGLKTVAIMAWGTGRGNIDLKTSIDGKHWCQKCCMSFYPDDGVNGLGGLDDISIGGWKYIKCVVTSLNGGYVSVISNAIP